MEIKGLVEQMTLEEKASLCSGKNVWYLKGIERLGIKEIMVTDGPHGLRKQADGDEHTGLSESVRSTCFPTASGSACSWNRDLLFKMGQTMAEACLEEKVSVLLGPGANIKRHPLCGRNFEYISEDPFLTGELAASIINGVQSKNVGTSLKHFAVNNQEYRRMVTDSVVDERTLREIYLGGFEIAVKKAQPWTIMCAYNQLDGIYCSDNKRLLTDILRDEWAYEGLVMTDWGACHDRVEGIKAGLELEMPSSGGINDQKIIEAVRTGVLEENLLDDRVMKVVKLIEDSKTCEFTYDRNDHYKMAKEVALESAVLLKNEDILPLDPTNEVLFVGEFFRSPRYQGSGSSLINPLNLTSSEDRMKKLKIPYQFASGYSLTSDQPQDVLISEAVSKARTASCVVIYAGLTDDYESEGFDRKHLNIPHSHISLIQAIQEINDNVVVVLQNGAPVVMPWEPKAKAIMEAYLGGEAGGEALIDLLYGFSNPSGKLAETFPLALEDILSNAYFGMGPHSVEYRENIYVGYRDYESFSKAVLYPFGHGLSYTSFEYSDISLSSDYITDSNILEVSVTVKNVGQVSGAEIVQLYIEDVDSTIHRPKLELKGFDKVFLQPGESQRITLTLNKRSFSYYHTDISDFDVESGDFMVHIGASVRDLRLSKKVFVESMTGCQPMDTRGIEPEFYSGQVIDISDQTFMNLIGRPYKANEATEKGRFTMNSTLGEMKHTMIGKRLYDETLKIFVRNGALSKSMYAFAQAMTEDMPLRSVALMSGGRLPFKRAEMLLDMMNGKMFMAIRKIF